MADKWRRQKFETGTVHPCKGCGHTMEVEDRPRRTGEFCNKRCAARYAAAQRKVFAPPPRHTAVPMPVVAGGLVKPAAKTLAEIAAQI